MFRIKTTYYALALAVTKPAITAATRGIITAATKAAVWVVTIAATLLSAACSKNEVVTTYEQEAAKPVYVKQEAVQQEVSDSPVPISFDASIGEQATTRALTPEEELLQNNGFGVFAYYTDNGTYNPSTSKPNFMYNQKVEWDDAWKYTPIKYWPNEKGSEESEGRTDRLTFYAYSPHVPVVSQGAIQGEASGSTGLDGGIIAFSGNDFAGGPYITYKQAPGVHDLLYATFVPANHQDQTKQSISSSISFEFNYALARINLLVTGIYDEVTATNNNINSNNKNTGDAAELGADNYIKVKSVRITLTYYDTSTSTWKDVKQTGRLNLRDHTWEMIDDGSTALIGVDASKIAEHLRWKDDLSSSSIKYGVGRYYTPETPATDNVPIPANASEEVRYHTLLADGNYIYFIPETQMRMRITINYHVYTKDDRMHNGLSDVENVVESKDIVGERDSEEDVEITPLAGNTYTIKMALGLTTVKMTVSEPVPYWNNSTEETNPKDENNPYKIPN